MLTATNVLPVDGDASLSAIHVECQALLDAAMRAEPSIVFGCLGTVDGRLFAVAEGTNHSAPPRLAAMTSSMLALGESFAKDSLRSSCTFVTISTDHGAIVTVRVPCRSRTFALSVGSDTSQIMAMTLRATLDLADRLASALDRN